MQPGAALEEANDSSAPALQELISDHINHQIGNAFVGTCDVF